MRIAQVAPLYESVPPKWYGGTERVVSYLTEALVERGHDVTLFASGDSTTQARLLGSRATALRLRRDWQDPLVYHYLMLEDVYRRAEEFDVVHFHVDYLHFPRTRAARIPNVTTLHGRLDLSDLGPLFQEFSDMPLVSISDAQRRPLQTSNPKWMGTVHHGLPVDLLPFNAAGGGYLVFLGRISPEKGPDRAIEIATRAGLPLKIAAKVDKVDEGYFREVVQPLLDTHPNVEFLGEVNETQKADLLGNALALLFPIEWPEPFGLVMIEAMACGTPVIAFHRGSVPEVMEQGVTGYLCADIDEAVHRAGQVAQLSRAAIRQQFETRFSSHRMAKDYEAIFQKVLRRSAVPAALRPSVPHGIGSTMTSTGPAERKTSTAILRSVL